MTETKLRLSKSRVSAKVRSVTPLGGGLTALTGAQFEFESTALRVPDRKDFAMEAARFLKSKHPHSMVEVEDLQSGDATAVALRSD